MMVTVAKMMLIINEHWLSSSSLVRSHLSIEEVALGANYQRPNWRPIWTSSWSCNRVHLLIRTWQICWNCWWMRPRTWSSPYWSYPSPPVGATLNQWTHLDPSWSLWLGSVCIWSPLATDIWKCTQDMIGSSIPNKFCRCRRCRHEPNLPSQSGLKNLFSRSQ